MYRHVYAHWSRSYFCLSLFFNKKTVLCLPHPAWLCLGPHLREVTDRAEMMKHVLSSSAGAGLGMGAAVEGEPTTGHFQWVCQCVWL